MSTPDAGIFARESPSLDRYVRIGVASGRVINVAFPDDADATDDHAVLDRIFDYLEGAEDDLADVTVGLTVATDHRDVLERVREVPYGEQVTVDVVARMTPGIADDEEGAEIVRGALADNPVPILVPDHRVRDGPSAAPPDVERNLRSLEGL